MQSFNLRFNFILLLLAVGTISSLFSSQLYENASNEFKLTIIPDCTENLVEPLSYYPPLLLAEAVHSLSPYEEFPLSNLSSLNCFQAPYDHVIADQKQIRNCNGLAMHQEFFANSPEMTLASLLYYQANAPYIPISRDGRKRRIFVDNTYVTFYTMTHKELEEQYCNYRMFLNDMQNDPSLNYSSQQAKRRQHDLQCALDKDTLQEQRLLINKGAEALLAECAISKNKFITMFGNYAQRALHQEFGIILNQTGDLYQQYDSLFKDGIKPACKDITTMASIGVESIWTGNLVHGYCIADWCTTVLNGVKDVATAVISGFKEGAIAFIEHVQENPMEVALTFYAPELVLAYHGLPLVWKLLKFSGHAGKIGLQYWWGNREFAQEEWQELIDPIRQTYLNLRHKDWSLSWQNALITISFTTQIFTQIALDHKINRQFQKIFAQAEKALIKAAQQDLLKEVKVVALPEGYSFKLVEEKGGVTLCRKSNGPRNVNQRNTKALAKAELAQSNLPDFIKGKRVPRSSETFLKDPSFKKLSRKFDKAAIFEKDGKYYYIDKLHTGKSAHIEVFSHNGTHLGIADPITGILDTSKKESYKLKL